MFITPPDEIFPSSFERVQSAGVYGATVPFDKSVLLNVPLFTEFVFDVEPSSILFEAFVYSVFVASSIVILSKTTHPVAVSVSFPRPREMFIEEEYKLPPLTKNSTVL